MTKFMTVVTVFVLLAMNSYAQTDANAAAKPTKDILAILGEMESIYEKGMADPSKYLESNAAVLTAYFEKCKQAESVFKQLSQGAPVAIERMKAFWEKNAENRVRLLDSSDAKYSAHVNFIQNLEHVRFCYGIKSRFSASKAISRAINN